MIIVTPFKTNLNKGQLIRVSRNAALRLIASLAEQLRTESPNSGRAEFYDTDNNYLSVAVLSDKDMLTLKEESWGKQKQSSANTSRLAPRSRTRSGRSGSAISLTESHP